MRSDIILDRLMSLHPKVIDLVLDRVWRLLDALDNPQTKLPPVIHIAGTNGKGSTQAMIRAGLEGAGKSVHAYTSPHLARFHERIRLAGELISENALQDILEECERANGGEPITYFEITTVAGLLAFSRTPADYTLLEVGLGGRLDATNVIDAPALTVITPISIDHTQFLGDTIEAIAGEKAGIIKRGVPCIVGPQPEAAMEVIERQAMRLGAPLLAYGQHWHVTEEHGRLIFQDETGLRDLPLPNLIGRHQVENAGMALAALRHLDMGDIALEAAVTGAQWPARMQRLKTGPLIDAAKDAEVWLDGGHNPAAGLALAEAMDRLQPRATYLICGMLNTKDIGGYLRPLARHAKQLIAVSIPGEAATLSAEDTAKVAQDVGMNTAQSGSVLDAVRSVTATDPNARILICGSLYLAGAVLRENG
ncbi:MULTISPECIES: bifunctional folylpolyglutamate synthase/dihydrofolate synthase [Pacificibacter]|uniref:bifunctional folylpolyglutamate synthase/dihydrofolate synthase n=1 Tax=Pacificibacter TaxID=1042323 RepID=UPI001C09F10F|nr:MULTISPECIES: folylpolyglutamate synthase/dihydrofolate synthase family protein [Pacificibacter]MBU2937275.1 bifunctional folylpolyglutamate synthase/dihydrofolate synthase [Pacificibacter marinus]MDO6615270.1 folylpolyglutamate synthase/dihydrofolate synthase family protein [Pacificibacter sp. 1_MG-2023]